MPEIDELSAEDVAKIEEIEDAPVDLPNDFIDEAELVEMSLPLDPMKSMSLPEPFDDDDYDDDDEDIDETLAERLMGLTEMFPQTLRTTSSNLVGFSVDATKWMYSTGRVIMWVAASSAVILALPVMFETERAQVEEQQMQQQRQLLLGPNAAVSGGGPPGMMPGMAQGSR